MSEMIERLARMKGVSEAKSYLIGLERGRIWAEDVADYFEIRQWSELTLESPKEVALPNTEEEHFHVIGAETGLEWEAYVRGWLEGVKEIYRKY